MANVKRSLRATVIPELRLVEFQPEALRALPESDEFGF